MRIRKFVASTMKDALEEVKRELGADAMIVGTRHVRRGLLGQGVEVTAAVDQLETTQSDFDADLDDDASGPTSMRGEEAPRRPSSAYAKVGGLAPRPHAAVPAAPAGMTDADLERIMNPLRAELRAMTRNRTSVAAVDTSMVDTLRREVSALQSMVQKMRPTPQGGAAAPLSFLARLEDAPLVAAPTAARITALVGPTGAGKTTSLAKLAARAALVEKRRVGIITMDTFRIGAEEQMRAYADLIGVPLYLCPEPARLGETVRRLSKCDRIFIDTPGYGPREEAALQTLAAALSTVEGLDVHLVVPAASTGAELDRAAKRYAATGASCLLFTKLDECDATEELVRAPSRLKLPVRYLGTGQRVPEDLEEATVERLLHLAERGLELDMQEAA